MSKYINCHYCGGDGQSSGKPCSFCFGAGVLEEERARNGGGAAKPTSLSQFLLFIGLLLLGSYLLSQKWGEQFLQEVEKRQKARVAEERAKPVSGNPFERSFP